jgi:hypothetical protein
MSLLLTRLPRASSAQGQTSIHFVIVVTVYHEFQQVGITVRVGSKGRDVEKIDGPDCLQGGSIEIQGRLNSGKQC